jgi:lipopolysaccharide export system permease protein
MLLIECYMFRRIGLLAFGALAVTTGIALTTQVLLRVDLLASSGQSLATIGRLALYLVPGMVAVALPFAVLIGILQTMRTMNQDSELVVLEASGSSILQRARPSVLVGLAATMICGVITLWAEPITNQKIRELLVSASGDLLSAAIQSGGFKQVDEGLFIQVAEKLPGGGFGGIFVSDARDPLSQVTYIAKTGSILNTKDRTLLVIQNGQIQRKNVAENSITFIKFDTYSLDAGTFSSANNVTFKAGERTTSYLLAPDVNDAEFQRSPEKLTRELHRRFSDPLYAIALAVLAIFGTVAAKNHRSTAAAALVLAALAGFSVRTIGFVLVSNSGANLLSVMLLYAFPMFVTALFGWWLFNGRQWPAASAFVTQSFEWASAKIALIRQMRRG